MINAAQALLGALSALSMFVFFFSSRRRHTRCGRDWSSDVCSSDLKLLTSPTRRPHRTMFLLMLRCGLRVGEVSSLPWAAIDLVQGTVRIDNSKGHVDRVVYLAPDVAKALRQWQGHQAAAAPYVFPSRGTSLTARQIRNLMTDYLKLAGIPKAYSPHSLRHTFATQLLNAGASLEVVKELMGHRSLDMTLRYTQLYDRTKRAQYDQAMAQVEKHQGFQRR